MRKQWIFTTLVFACALGAAQAQTSTSTSTQMGSSMTKPSAIQAFGKGVQIYTCTTKSGRFAWTLKAPDAALTDAHGKSIATHFAGPTWRAIDGSSVVGEPLNSSPSPDGAIPWLVLHAKSHAGKGVMANVDYIVRTRTEGGVAPAEGCDASHPGAVVRVPYSAIYLFFPHAA